MVMSKLKSQPQEIRICFVGESFINGTGDPDFLGWTGRVCANAHQKGYEITYYNLGVRSETSRFLKQRWQQEVSYRLTSEYDGRVVFSFGVNDLGWAGNQQGIDLQRIAIKRATDKNIKTNAGLHFATHFCGGFARKLL
jgi:lysophospholipase L1-like esterase